MFLFRRELQNFLNFICLLLNRYYFNKQMVSEATSSYKFKNYLQDSREKKKYVIEKILICMLIDQSLQSHKGSNRPKNFINQNSIIQKIIIILEPITYSTIPLLMA